MDLLSVILRELRFESVVYRWLELDDPFRVGFDQPGPTYPRLRGVHIVARGGCDLVLDDDGTTIGLGQGDLVILPRGDSHTLRSTGGGAGGGRVDGASAVGVPRLSSFELAMGTPGTRLRAGGPSAGDGVADDPGVVVVCGAFVIGEPDHPALRGLPRTMHVPGVEGRTPAWLAPYVDALAAEAFDGGPGSDVVMARLSDALLARTLRHHSQTVDQPGWLAGLRDPYIATALDAMHQDLARPWTVASLARTVGLSRAAFAARFTERIGEPVIGYLLSLRMQRARTLLRDERATVASVATAVGYSSEVAFATAFKRQYGAAPGAYRRASSSRHATA